MLRQEVPLKDLGRIVVQLEHRGVELQDVLRADLGRTRCLRADDRLEVGRHLGALRLRAEPDDCK
jgi:hypothetical protein